MTTRTIRSPLEWVYAQMMHVAHGIAWFGGAMRHAAATIHSPAPALQRISVGDVRQAVMMGLKDFAAYRSDIFFLLLFYPALNLMLARIAFGMNLLPLLFPLVSGFAIIAPLTAIGLCEMSRQREQGLEVSWRNGFDVIHRPAIGGIMLLGMLLAGLFLLWLAVAWMIFQNTMGPEAPASLVTFARDVLTTPAGHDMIVIGFGVGFVFALVAMMISVVSFPMLVDRDVGLDTAIRTSIRAVIANPVPMAGWGMVVAIGLVIGSLPMFIGLIVVMPILGHATWHLYRKLVQN